MSERPVVKESEAASEKDAGRRKRQLVVHPLLFAAFPVLYLFAHNIQEGVSAGDLLRALVPIIGAAGILFAIATLVLRDYRKAGLVVSALVLLFFSYGHVYLAVKGWRIGGVSVGRHAVLGTLWILLIAGVLLLSIRTKRGLHELTTVLNVVAAGLVLLNSITVIQFQARSSAAEKAAIKQGNAGFQGHLPDPDEVRKREGGGTPATTPRDVYYIILDTYSGETGLRKVFNFDNTAFLSWLESRGFYVAHKSTANYPRTMLSVASSLNMEYLDFLTRELGEETNDVRPLTRLMKYNRVARFLKSVGYQYTQIGSWWGPTSASPTADRNVIYGGGSEFDKVLYQTTALQPIRHEEFRRHEWKRVQFQFDALEKTKTLKGPKFVFAHILLPHSPFVFYPDGRYRPEKDLNPSREQNYLDQLEYANSRTKRMLNVLLSGPESSHPIVLLQSDEGPYEGAPTIWGKPAAKDLIRKFPNLNTYYLPGVSHADLYPTITPVNSFRLVFNLYFGANLAMLPDRDYVFRSLRRVYDFRDVTDEVRTLMSG